MWYMKKLIKSCFAQFKAGTNLQNSPMNILLILGDLGDVPLYIIKILVSHKIFKQF